MRRASASTAWRRRCRARCGFAGTPEQPVRAAAPWVDFGTASLLALGVVGGAARARDDRTRTIGGRRVAAHGADLFQPDPDRRGCAQSSIASRRSTAARRRDRPTSIKAKDGWITVAVNGDPLFRRAAKLIGAPEWLDGSAIRQRQGARRQWRDHQRARRRHGSRQRTSAEAIAAFEGARVPAGPVYRPREALDDPHVKRRRFFCRAWTSRASAMRKIAATPVKLHDTPGEVRRARRSLGEHTDQILRELGYSPAEIDALKQEGAV